MKTILFFVLLFCLASCLSEEIPEDPGSKKTEQSETPEETQKFQVVDTKLGFFRESSQMSVQMKIRNIGEVPLKDPISIDIYYKLSDTDQEEKVVTAEYDLKGLKPNMVSEKETLLTFPDKYFDKDQQFQLCITTPYEVSYWDVDYSIKGNINVPDWEEGGEIIFTPYDPNDPYDPNNPNSPYYKGNK